MNNLNTAVKYITRFRLGSHLLPVETGLLAGGRELQEMKDSVEYVVY